MKYSIKIILILFFISNLSYSQVSNSLYELNMMDNLLTKKVKDVVSKNIDNKRVVFLGESEHHIGSDFLAKTEFIKYLVQEKGYKNIVFESDFFGLYFDHEKYNVFPHWAMAVQCQELFKFLDDKNVTIWGMDNQTHSYFTYHNFINKFTEYLENNDIEYESKFLDLVSVVIKNGASAHKKINKKEATYLISSLEALRNIPKVKADKLWHQIIESFQSTVEIYTIHRGKKEGIPIRDKQMASNLNFLVKNNSNGKFIVWAANAHMSKLQKDFMKGKTMGHQFVEMNPDISYHIAFSSIHMPYRKDRKIKRASEDNENLLHFLPTTTQNYFVDSKQLIMDQPNFEEQEFEGMFHLDNSKTNWFKHFDALVFIGQGERAEKIE